MKGVRYTGTWYKLKTEAREAESKRKEEIKNPNKQVITPIEITFSTLVDKKLEYMRTHNSMNHCRDYRYHKERWEKKWGHLKCGEITRNMIQSHLDERLKVRLNKQLKKRSDKKPKEARCAANQNLRNLRATFNFGKKFDHVTRNPTKGIDFFPVEKKIKYVPPFEDIAKVIASATPDTQDYLLTIKYTLARVSEINCLTWDDIILAKEIKDSHIILKTRKKKGGNLTPRYAPMNNTVYKIMSRRYSSRDESIPWVFWHKYKSRKTGKFVVGPYQDRKVIMKNLCEKAGVKYFRFHALRHAGASFMENNNYPIGAIQGLLGHESRLTTEIYLHSAKNIARQAMEFYENVS